MFQPPEVGFLQWHGHRDRQTEPRTSQIEDWISLKADSVKTKQKQIFSLDCFPLCVKQIYVDNDNDNDNDNDFDNDNDNDNVNDNDNDNEAALQFHV